MNIVHVLRKPISEKTIAANCLEHGTGALNIDPCRVPAPHEVIQTHSRSAEASQSQSIYGEYGPLTTGQTNGQKLGRWPANTIFVHHEDCILTGYTEGEGYAINRWSDGAKPFGHGAGHPYESESVKTIEEKWTCAGECPVPRFATVSKYFKQVRPKGALHNACGWNMQHLHGYLGRMTTPGPTQGFDGVCLEVFEDTRLDHVTSNSVHSLLVLTNQADPVALNRVLVPGGHALFLAPSCFHLVCHAEDIGFEVRDAILLIDHHSDKVHFVKKANKKEREKGLDGFEDKNFGMSGGAQAAMARNESYEEAQGIGLNRVSKRKNTHPTIKPVGVMERLLSDIEPQSKVLDPFMGSGTTGVAAKNYAFTGIEKEKEYYDIAVARVAARS